MNLIYSANTPSSSVVRIIPVFFPDTSSIRSSYIAFYRSRVGVISPSLRPTAAAPLLP
jgi:hypothetical protein